MPPPTSATWRWCSPAPGTSGTERPARGAWRDPRGATPARILGIDPGLNRTGWGVIESLGGRMACVEAGVIRVPSGELPDRLATILAELGAVIRQTRPTRASVEKVFVNVNPQATLLLGQARGAAICAAVAAGLPVREHTALQVKQAVVGYGKASKEQVQVMYGVHCRISGRWRSALGANAGDWYIDRPNVLNHRISQPLAGTEATLIRQMIDIASNGIDVRPDASQNSFEIQVHQGVAETVAEMLVLGSDFGTAANTASVFGRLAEMNRSRGFVIGARDDTAVGQLPWPEDQKARIAAHVGAGYMVVVPRQAVEIDGEQHVGWWRIDPASGETIGVMDSGYHTASEDAAMKSALEALHKKLMIAYIAAGGGGGAATVMMRGQEICYG